MKNTFVVLFCLFVFTACQDKETVIIPSGKVKVIGFLASKKYLSDPDRFGVLKILERSEGYLDNGDRLHVKILSVEGDPLKDFNDLVQTPDIIAVISFLGSKEMLSLKDAIQEAKIPLIITTATHSKLSGIKYVSRICLSDRSEANVAAAYLRDELYIPEVTVIKDSKDVFSQELSALFVQRYKQLGGKVGLTIDSAEFDQENEFISKLIDEKVDTLYITTDAHKSKLLLEQLQKAKLEVKILAYDGFISDFLSQYPYDAKMLNGIYVVDNYANDLKLLPKAAKIAKEISKEGLRIDTYDALSYDAWMLLKQSLNACAGLEDECLNAHLRNTDSFEGAVDNLSMHEGDITRPVYVNEIEDAKMNMMVKVY